MQFLYGERNILRALDESDFWKRQESEHTTVIQVVTPDLEAVYKKALDQFKLQFDEVYSFIKRFLESAVRLEGNLDRELEGHIVDLIAICEKQSTEFVALLKQMLAESQAVKKSNASQTLINHIIRESEYYLGITQLITPTV